MRTRSRAMKEKVRLAGNRPRKGQKPDVALVDTVRVWKRERVPILMPLGLSASERAAFLGK